MFFLKKRFPFIPVNCLALMTAVFTKIRYIIELYVY